MAKDKQVVNEALDLLDGICSKVGLDRQNHYNVQQAVRVIKEEINREEAPKEDE